ncbi:MAG TPA: hypothetical protein VGK67_16685 [Myxococcales bacterium]|jgi:hypothetical protein
MRTIVAAMLPLFAASCGPSATPCTTCMNVQGTYEVVVEGRSADSSTCDQLYISGGTAEVELYQTGSELSIPLLFESEGGMNGTLFNDDTARFGPKNAKVGNTYPAVYAHVVLNGAFTGEEADRRFSGSLMASTSLDGKSCALSTPVRMTKKKTAP